LQICQKSLGKALKVLLQQAALQQSENVKTGSEIVDVLHAVQSSCRQVELSKSKLGPNSAERETMERERGSQQ